MAAARRLRALLVAIASAAALASTGVAASGSDSPGITAGSSDMFELVARFEGPWAQVVGTPHEWWSPREGFYRADHATARDPFMSVYDGVTMTRRRGDKVFRVEGERAMLRYLVSRPSWFDLPAIAAVRQYVRHERPDAIRVTPDRSGRSFAVDIHIRDENGVDDHIRYTVDVLSAISLQEARTRGLLRPLTGPLVGILKQSRPGTRPHFGQAGYWFGRSLGKARAVTLLEQRGADPLRGDERARPPSYTTIYRFPGSRPADYPGLGNQGPSDVRVECRAREKGWLPGVSANQKGRAFRLADGTAATLYLEPYTQGTRSGVFANIVVGKTACFIHGLIAPRDLVHLAATTFRRA
jgi:hypothetical protein